MEISGLIKDIPVELLLQQAEAEEQTGVLFLKSEHAIGEVAFENGLIYSADSPLVRERLGQKLVFEGLIQASDLYLALREQDNDQGRLLGEILLQKKLLSSEKVKEVVNRQIQEAVLHLVMWDKGQFSFERTVPERRHLVHVRPARLLEEKKLRLEELKSFAGKGPMEKIENHPDPGIHQKLYGEVTHTVTRAKTFEPRVVVLLVEGDAKWRMMVQDELGKQNFHVKGVSNTEKAKFEIERMLEKGYKPIVVTDIDFPHQQEGSEQEGLVFMENLHQVHSEIPILVSTSYPISNLRRKILFLGGVFCLVKPDLSILSSKNFEQIFQAFFRELTYCLDISIHHYYQEYFHERAEIIKNDLLEELYNTKRELMLVGDQLVAESRVRETFNEISGLLVKEGNVDRSIDKVLEFMVGRYDHVALFLWGKKYLNGHVGASAIRADFSERVKTVSVEYGKFPLLKRMYEQQESFEGPPPGDKAYGQFLGKFLDHKPGWQFLYPVVVAGRVVALWYADKPKGGERDPYTTVFTALINMLVLTLKVDMEKD